MPTISFAIIARNEADILQDCLESVKWADEQEVRLPLIYFSLLAGKSDFPI
ncbi:MAG: hypothetical protein L6420_04660 [Elusimicrobia bacterium]|nr:hypothetical protein [Elusimicrobiota bacterium]